MKKFIIAITLASLVGIGCEKKEPKPVAKAWHPAGNRTPASESAGNSLPAAMEKVGDATGLNLTPTQITSELEHTGRIVRAKTAAPGQTFGEPADNSRLVTVINSKLVTDEQLPVLKIRIEVDRGVVTLNGTVKSAAIIGRVVQLALATEGVSQVVSLVRVDPNA